MADYQIFETNEFRKKLKKLGKQTEKIIDNKLSDHVFPIIKKEPRIGKNIKKLKGYMPETWRYRIGEYRLFYLIDDKDKSIYFITVDNRKDIYKK